MCFALAISMITFGESVGLRFKCKVGCNILLRNSNPQVYLPQTLEAVPDWRMVNDVEDGH